MRTGIVLALLATMLVFSLFATPLYASGSTSEAWVSGTFGNDSNASTSCQRTAPCATLSTALGVTAPGGIVFCADPSATIGPMPISQDVTIDCSATGGVVNLSCLGGDGIIINTTGINVTLRGLTVVGPPCAMAPVGIDITAAATVRMEHCKISGFSTAGVEVAPSSGNVVVKIQDSTITQNGAGVLVVPTGSASVSIGLDRSRIENNNGGGIHTDSSNGAITVDIADSTISYNVSNGFNVTSGTGTQNDMVNIIRTTIAKNGLVGIQTGGSHAAVLLNASTLDSNTNGATLASNGARIISYGNNQIIGTPGSGFTGSAPLQ
jgi:hypothetical protein